MEAYWTRSQASSSPGENLAIDALGRSHHDPKVLKGKPWRHSQAHIEQRAMGIERAYLYPTSALHLSDVGTPLDPNAALD